MSVTEVRELRAPSPLQELVRFVVLAFAGAWLIGGVGLFVLDLGELGLGMGVLMVAVAAVICARRDDGSIRPFMRRVVRWRVAPRWYAAALGVPFVALIVALLLAPLFGGQGDRSESAGLSLLFMLPLFLLLYGGPEELGWRGYALPRLQTRFNALVASLLLSGIWMAWHAPLFFMSDVPVFADLAVAPYLTVGVASSVVYTWLYNSTHGSVLLAMLLHAAKNLSLGFLLLSVDFVLYAAAWVLFAVVVVTVYGPTHLSRCPRHHMTSPV